MKRILTAALIAVSVMGIWACASAPRRPSDARKASAPAKIEEQKARTAGPEKPAKQAEPAAAKPAEKAQTAAAQSKPQQPSAPAKNGGGKANGLVEAPPQDPELENKPLPVLPNDPPPPPNASDLGDDAWARDQRSTILKDKDRAKVRNSEPDDDVWARD